MQSIHHRWQPMECKPFPMHGESDVVSYNLYDFSTKMRMAYLPAVVSDTAFHIDIYLQPPTMSVSLSMDMPCCITPQCFAAQWAVQHLCCSDKMLSSSDS